MQELELVKQVCLGQQVCLSQLQVHAFPVLCQRNARRLDQG